YILYPDAETKERVIDRSSAERYRASVAILEAKKLHHPLSQLSRHQQRYPHQQIRNYLDEAQILSWGNELFGATTGEVKVDTCIVIVRKSGEYSEAITECLTYHGFQRVPRIAPDTASTRFSVKQVKWLTRQNAEITLGTGRGEAVLSRIESSSRP